MYGALQENETPPFHFVKRGRGAEREGFEPPEPRGSTVFKTAAIDRSAISPGAKVIIRNECEIKILRFWRINGIPKFFHPDIQLI